MNILVISLAGIGDTLFATPLIHELRANYPAARIDALVLWQGSREVLEGNPHLNTIYQKNLLQVGKLEALRFLAALRRNHYDVSFNTHPQSRIHYRAVARLVGAPLRLSHQYDRPSGLDGWLVNRTLAQDYSRHSVENNLGLLTLLERSPLLASHEYELFLTAAELAWADDYIASHHLEGRTLLGLHVGSGGTKNLALRRWPLASYIELVNRLLIQQPNLRILAFGGPEEQQDNLLLAMKSDPQRVLRPESHTLRQAAALLRKCSLFLSVDTALMHLAAAMKVPWQLVIETPTWNRPIEPFNQHFTLIRNPEVTGRNLDFYRYDGLGIKGSPEELQRIMGTVTVEAVFKALAGAL